MSVDVSTRLSWCLFFCRVAVFIIFVAWGYDKLVRPDHGVAMMANYYFVSGISETLITLFGVVELALATMLLLGLYKRFIRGVFLFLSLLAVSVPEVLKGYYTAIADAPNPTILFFTGFCLLACSFGIYYLRDLDTKFCFADKNKPSESELNDENEHKLALFLAASRFGVFIVFFVWTLAKFIHPEHGVNIMRGHYLIDGVTEAAVTIFGLFELVLCIALILGLYKRVTRSFFLLISIYSVITPRVLNGYKIFIFENSEPQIFLFSGFSMLACAIAIYWLRDYDTRFCLPFAKSKST
jgi:uncharacterized membrane protein YphA (DoxX/SURF4 family)